MEIDPLNPPGQDRAPSGSTGSRERWLNSRVAIMVALLATFMGICKVKDDNLVQAMQQAQANKIDNWSFYQARNIASLTQRRWLFYVALVATCFGVIMGLAGLLSWQLHSDSLARLLS
jgi:hypothetical protein